MPLARPLGPRDPAALSSTSVDRRVVRRSKGLGEAAGGDRSADFGGFGADPGVEVLAAQPVAVAFEAQDL
jgi:hypothetical protein